MAPQRSLKARALQWLAQREHSRVELRRKLLACALAQAATDAEAQAASQERADVAPAATTLAAPAARVDELLEWLEAHRYLSSERFVESRVHARSARFGNARIRHELRQHQLALSPSAAKLLAESESARACAVRARKFPQPPASLAERARQARFLAGRGFSADAIARALRAAVDDDEVAERSAD